MKPNLASPPDPKYPLTFAKYGSSKLDGIRGLTQYNTATSRTLKPIPNVKLREWMASFQGVDGELIYGSPTAPDVYHKTYSAVMTENGTLEGITYYVFDTLDKTKPYAERYADLLGMALPEGFKVLPQVILHSPEDLDTFYTRQLELGYEGAILRNGSAYYKEGRATAKSQDMLKFKPFLDSDGIVVDIYEAKTNNNEEFVNELGHTARSSHAENLVGNGMAGGMTIQMGKKIFNISCGVMTHQERIELLANTEFHLGRMATFRHLPIGEKDVPRHGRFMRWKDPK